MAIITDPDFLDRAQVIFGPTTTRGGSFVAPEAGVLRRDLCGCLCGGVPDD